MRILLLKCTLSCMLRQNSSDPWNSSVLDSLRTSISVASKIPELVDGILASVPYLLGEVDQNGNSKFLQ